MDANKELEEILAAKEQKAEINKDTGKKLKALRVAIKAGETSTGDTLKDFLIVMGGWDEEFAKPFREIEEMLNSKEGKQALIVYRHERIQGCPGIVSPDYIRQEFIGIEDEIYFGVCNGGLVDYDMKSGHILLPFTEHLRGNWARWHKKEGPVKLPYYYATFFGQNIPMRRSGVRSIAEFNRAFRIFIEPKFPPYLQKDGNPTSRYVDALKILEIKTGKRMHKKIEANLMARRRGILDLIEARERRALRLQAAIDEIYSKIGSCYYDPCATFGCSSTYNENKADYESMGLRRELKELKGNMQHSLESALEFDMHTRPWIESRTLPGSSLDVPVFISAMCEKYKVDT